MKKMSVIAGTIVVVGIVLGIFIAVPITTSASSYPVLEVSDGQVYAIGETATINITLSEAPNGLSGYNLSISLSNASVAEIISVSFPGWVTLYSNSSLPADSVWIKAVDLNDKIKSNDTNITLASITLICNGKGKTDLVITVTKMDDDDGNPINVSASTGLIEVVKACFDTGPGTYPSIPGTHICTITPSENITVSKLYTYPCPGTGGHTEYAAIAYANGTVIAEAHWNGYIGDWHNISFDKEFTLFANQTYNLTIRTGSYPQIIHEHSKEVTGGTITCISFVDANGRRYNNWIPAIRLE